jgi:hypothetical protein
VRVHALCVRLAQGVIRRSDFREGIAPDVADALHVALAQSEQHFAQRLGFRRREIGARDDALEQRVRDAQVSSAPIAAGCGATCIAGIFIVVGRSRRISLLTIRHPLLHTSDVRADDENRKGRRCAAPQFCDAMGEFSPAHGSNSDSARLCRLCGRRHGLGETNDRAQH